MLLQDFLNGFIQKIISFLPADPIQPYIASLNLSGTWLNYLNWLVPVGVIVEMLLAWTAAITIWYVWSTLARWLHMVS